MEAFIATSTRVAIFVEGGVVQGYSNDEDLLVIVVDRDSLNEEENRAKGEDEVIEGTEDCIHNVF